jgi:hypothetical protein
MPDAAKLPESGAVERLLTEARGGPSSAAARWARCRRRGPPAHTATLNLTGGGAPATGMQRQREAPENLNAAQLVRCASAPRAHLHLSPENSPACSSARRPVMAATGRSGTSNLARTRERLGSRQLAVHELPDIGARCRHLPKAVSPITAATAGGWELGRVKSPRCAARRRSTTRSCEEMGIVRHGGSRAASTRA